MAARKIQNGRQTVKKLFLGEKKGLEQKTKNFFPNQ